MSLSENLAAYEDCIKLWELAEQSAKGARAAFKTEALAMRWRMRMNMARRITRDEAKRLYPHDDPAWGKTLWDKYKITVRGPDPNGEWYVYVEPHGQEVLDMESLDNLESGEAAA
jgi:hypothetical protein